MNYKFVKSVRRLQVLVDNPRTKAVPVPSKGLPRASTGSRDVNLGGFNSSELMITRGKKRIMEEEEVEHPSKRIRRDNVDASNHGESVPAGCTTASYTDETVNDGHGRTEQPVDHDASTAPVTIPDIFTNPCGQKFTSTFALRILGFTEDPEFVKNLLSNTEYVEHPARETVVRFLEGTLNLPVNLDEFLEAKPEELCGLFMASLCLLQQIHITPVEELNDIFKLAEKYPSFSGIIKMCVVLRVCIFARMNYNCEDLLQIPPFIRACMGTDFFMLLTQEGDVSMDKCKKIRTTDEQAFILAINRHLLDSINSDLLSDNIVMMDNNGSKLTRFSKLTYLAVEALQQNMNVQPFDFLLKLELDQGSDLTVPLKLTTPGGETTVHLHEDI